MCKWGTTEKVKLMEVDLGSLNNKQYKLYLKKTGLQEGEEFIDSCIAPLVQALNDGKIKTTNSCCGHGKTFGEIYLQDRILLIINDKKKYRSNQHKYLIKMVLNHILGSYKVRLKIEKNNFVWRLKNLRWKPKEDK